MLESLQQFFWVVSCAVLGAMFTGIVFVYLFVLLPGIIAFGMWQSPQFHNSLFIIIAASVQFGWMAALMGNPALKNQRQIKIY